MKTRRKHLPALLLVFVLAITFSDSVSAVGSSTYHAPALTVVAPFAPADLKMTVTIFKNTYADHRVIPVKMEARRKGWEMQYFLRREMVYGVRTWYGNAYDLKDATLTLEYNGESRTFPISDEFLSERSADDRIRINWRTGRMSALSPLRTPLLLLMWSAIAIAVEAVVLWFYGYRDKQSWKALIIVNLITQSAHHLLITGTDVDADLIRMYGISMPLLFLVEMIAFLFSIEEHDHNRTVSFAVTANVASQAVMIPLMSVLPT